MGFRICILRLLDLLLFYAVFDICSCLSVLLLVWRCCLLWMCCTAMCVRVVDVYFGFASGFVWICFDCLCLFCRVVAQVADSGSYCWVWVFGVFLFVFVCGSFVNLFNCVFGAWACGVGWFGPAAWVVFWVGVLFVYFCVFNCLFSLNSVMFLFRGWLLTFGLITLSVVTYFGFEFGRVCVVALPLLCGLGWRWFVF